MFRKNESYKQQNLFDVTSQLTKKQRKMLEKSKEHIFFEQVFMQIDEGIFSDLYSTKKSRPNVAVNRLVGALILKHSSNWTYEELFKNLTFNILTRHAIGINNIEEDAFSEASLFNFLNKMSDHLLRGGEDLMEKVFEKLTANQIEIFEIKTNIQRGDSFLMGSNIVDYTRLNLVLEVLLRLFRQLEESDKKQIEKLIEKYTTQKSSNYVYRLSKEELPKELEKLGGVYHEIYEKFKSSYGEEKVFKIFERTYQEHFKLEVSQVKVIPSKELNSGILMSPDDDEATFRNKGKKKSKGFVGHISETANPKNEFNLITDLAVKPNNTDDAKILEERLPEMINKTPDLEEYHCDGLYGNPEVDKITADKIKLIQATMRGRRSSVKMRLRRTEEGQIMASCEGGQDVEAHERGQTYVADFDLEKCNVCPLREKCKAKETGVKQNKNPRRVKTFTKTALQSHIRMENIKTIPKERRTIRANVEATVKECKRGIKNGKLRVRRLQKAKWYLVCTAIAINSIRIHQYLTKKTGKAVNIFVISYMKPPGLWYRNRIIAA